ncbi:MAG: hypothetical protein NTY87_10345 [Planctomycetia bacterium]|nr:hypothetical protein [Planctomycetia bacterium]RLT12494.1 MAG: hypothetical protein DWI25_09230 [Planctomycetota bacterium]
MTLSPATRCAIVTHASVEANLLQIAQLRELPDRLSPAVGVVSDDVPPLGPQLPKRFLRHCDEHTVVAMAAVLAAMHTLPESLSDMSRWGVLAAPCLAGRLLSARTLAQLPKTGAAGVSPHLIPQCSLHAMASAVSVGLGMHGPNMGVGGGPEAVAEGFVTALSMLGEPDVPGLWLVLTQWDDEPIPDGAGGATNGPLCRSVAMALVATTSVSSDGPTTLGLTLTLPVEGGPSLLRPSGNPLHIKLKHLATSLDAIVHQRRTTATHSVNSYTRWSHDCDWGARLEVA